MFVAPLVWLLGTVRPRAPERYGAALELNRAYRGTVMLLADVVEADDNYTADHCRSVVSLVTAVADELEIDEDSRQELEFVALLHDVGKIAIPKEILNKPGALTDDEFELMKTHTIEGQVLLDRVGGLLGAGRRRSCAPATSAGTATATPTASPARRSRSRPHRVRLRRLQRHDHRPPLPRGDAPGEAIEELRDNAGTQFDPQVVAALASVIKRGGGAELSPAHAVRTVLAGTGVTDELPAEIRAAQG